MSTYTSEPGTRLGGRYRLEDRVSAGSGWSAWKAIDETLARAVAVLTFAPGFPRITQAVTAARVASRLTDARLAQVFDVEEDWDHAYVVLEWVSGDSLGDLLADSPLEPSLGTEIICQAAEALASAHAAGIAHLCLTPESLHWTAGGGVKVLGLGLDAALANMTADDPALADTQGLGRLLYAALTAHWPGRDWPALPPAPEVGGHPRSPRQVRAGVPAVIDEITCRVLLPGLPHGEPITSPAGLASALAAALPAVAPPAAPAAAFLGPLPAAPGAPYWDRDRGPSGRGPGRKRPVRNQRTHGTVTITGRGPRAPRTMVAAVTVLVLAAIALGGWTFLHRGHSGGPATRGHHHAAPPAHAVSVLKPVKALGFDPLSSSSADPNNENSQEAPYAIDGNPATAWHTQYYLGNPRFGGLKSGTGLILDMGKPVRLSSVTVTFGPVPGANVRIEVGNSNTRSPATLHTFTTVARATGLGGSHTFAVSSTAKGRYVLIWFTKLPPAPGSAAKFEAEIYTIVVKGTS
jgi:hypothetical protein